MAEVFWSERGSIASESGRALPFGQDFAGRAIENGAPVGVSGTFMLGFLFEALKEQSLRFVAR